jgi:hypothetical protein
MLRPHDYEDTRASALSLAGNRRSGLWVFCRERRGAGAGEGEGSNGLFRNRLRNQSVLDRRPF